MPLKPKQFIEHLKMNRDYHQYTTYKDIEDLKRLDFIIKSILDLNNSQLKILDVGCGNGNIALALGSLGYTVTGIDIDINSIDTAKTRNTFSNVTFKVLDANYFLLQDEFDVVVCSEVLEHLEKPHELLASIHTILKNNGMLIATVPNGYGPREVLVTKPTQWLTKKSFDKAIMKVKKFLGYTGHTLQSSNPDLTHIQFFSVSKFRRLLSESGFKINTWKNADFFERVFPYSWFTKRIIFLQKLDCAFADLIPKSFSSGFYTSWTKK